MNKFFKTYGQLINESNDSFSSKLYEAAKKDDMGKPKTISKVDIFKPKEGSDKDKHRIINPVTKHPIEISAYLDILKDIQKLNSKKSLTPEEKKRLTSYSKYKDSAKEVERVASVVTKFIGTSVTPDVDEKPSSTNKSVKTNPAKSVKEIEQISKSSNERTKSHYKKGFVKGAAPGNAGSMLNENGSNHSSSIMFNKKMKENDAVYELYKDLKGGELLNQQSSGLPKEILKSEINKIKQSDKRLANIPDNQLARIVLSVRGGKAKSDHAEKVADQLKWDKKNCTFQGFFGDKDGLEAQRNVAKNAAKILAPDGSEMSQDELLHFINHSGKAENPSDTVQFLTNKKTGEVVVFFTSDKDSVGAIVANSSFSAEGQGKIEKNKELIKNKILTAKQAEEADKIINKHIKSLQSIESELKGVAGIPAAQILKSDQNQVLKTLKTMGTKWGTTPDKYYNLIIKNAKTPKEEKEKLSAFLNKAKNEPDKLTGPEIKVLAKLKEVMNISDKESNIAIEKIRKRAIAVEMKMKDELNKTKVKVGGKNIGLGDYHDANNIIEKMHLSGALGKKEGVFSRPGLFKVVCAGPVIDDDTLQSCLGTDNMDDFILKFGSEPDLYQMSSEGNITGSSRIVYFLDEKKKKIKVAEKRQRSTQGELGKFSATYKWSEDMQKCFKSKHVKESLDNCESCKKSNIKYSSYNKFLNEKYNNI